MTTTATETWLDVMPAIPLARGVPVVNSSTSARWVICSRAKAGEMDSNPRMRVDLDDPQGFGHALRHYYDGEENLLPPGVRGWFGIAVVHQDELAEMNDYGSSFAEIADYIEKNL